MNTPTNDYEALVLALRLAITAPSEAKAAECVAMAEGIAANLSELEIVTERLSNQVYLSEKGLSRVGEDALIEESTRFAKENIKSQATTALLSQAFSVSEKVLQVIL